LTRRVTIVVVLVTVLLVGGLLIAATVHWVNAKESTPEEFAMRTRLTTAENDQFVRALLAIRHTTSTTQEILECKPQRDPRAWNLRVVVAGNIDADQVTNVLGTASSYGWTDTGDDNYRKTIAPGVVALMAADTNSSFLQLWFNLSDGLCSS
jgi:hypothetical protein